MTLTEAQALLPVGTTVIHPIHGLASTCTAPFESTTRSLPGGGAYECEPHLKVSAWCGGRRTWELTELTIKEN